MPARILFAIVCLFCAVSTGAAQSPNAPRTSTAVLAAPSLPQPPQDSILTWSIVSAAQAKEITARLTTGLLSTRPHFDVVRLERENGTTRIACGTFGRPTLTENGANRFWNYAMSRSTSGPCAVPGVGRFVAVGVKDGVERSTQPVP